MSEIGKILKGSIARFSLRLLQYSTYAIIKDLFQKKS
jgi:hypothetical protein